MADAAPAAAMEQLNLKEGKPQKEKKEKKPKAEKPAQGAGRAPPVAAGEACGTARPPPRRPDAALRRQGASCSGEHWQLSLGAADGTACRPCAGGGKGDGKKETKLGLSAKKGDDFGEWYSQVMGGWAARPAMDAALKFAPT